MNNFFNEKAIEIHAFLFKKCVWKYRLQDGVHFVSASNAKPVDEGEKLTTRKWNNVPMLFG